MKLSSSQRKIYEKYAKLYLPRHTSYPTANHWQSVEDNESHHRALQDCAGQRSPLSLYFHIPYCSQLCYYCGCSKQVVNTYKQV